LSADDVLNRVLAIVPATAISPVEPPGTAGATNGAGAGPAVPAAETGPAAGDPFLDEQDPGRDRAHPGARDA
jgi:hypothetical protein